MLVCNHDIHMGQTTDVAKQFPDRARADGRYYFIDFTVAELKTLAVKGRNDAAEPGYQIPTLAEMLAMIARLNDRTGRAVGTIPEPKTPAWHREQGHPIEAKLLDQYRSLGYTQPHRPGDRAMLRARKSKRMRKELKSDLRLVYLLAQSPDDGTLDELATFADGIGPAAKMIENDGQSVADNALVRRATTAGCTSTPTLLARRGGRPTIFWTYDVDGLFSDFPDVAVRARAPESLNPTADASRLRRSPCGRPAGMVICRMLSSGGIGNTARSEELSPALPTHLFGRPL